MSNTTASDPTAAALIERVWFTAQEAATYLGMHEKTIRDAHLDGRLRAARTAPKTPRSRGGALRFRREWLDAFAAGQPAADAKPVGRRTA